MKSATLAFKKKRGQEVEPRVLGEADHFPVGKARGPMARRLNCRENRWREG